MGDRVAVTELGVHETRDKVDDERGHILGTRRAERDLLVGWGERVPAPSWCSVSAAVVMISPDSTVMITAPSWGGRVMAAEPGGQPPAVDGDDGMPGGQLIDGGVQERLDRGPGASRRGHRSRVLGDGIANAARQVPRQAPRRSFSAAPSDGRGQWLQRDRQRRVVAGP